MKLLRRLAQQSVSGLVRLASLLALVGLLVMSVSVIWPRALLVIFAMSVGHLIGAGAFALYLLAVVIDARRASRAARDRASSPPSSGNAPPSSGKTAS